jgi:CheY-like chemotaxis protein
MARKLLLADDSLTIQKVIELVMTPEDFEIKVFNDGEQALQALKAFAPDIILADIDMPKLNGYQLCEKIKNDMAIAHIPVILLAGAFEPFNEEYAKAVYADDYIIKPFESQELISKVNALLPALAASGTHAATESYSYEAAPASATEKDIFSISPGTSAETPGEPKWDEEMPIVDEEEKIESMEAEEEYEARVALFESVTGDQSGKTKDFKEVLSGVLAGALKESPVPEQMDPPKVADFWEHTISQNVMAIHMPSKDEITDIFKNTIEEKVSAHIPVLINTDALPQISSAIENSAERMVSDIVSGIVGNVTGKITKNIMEILRAEINSAVNRIVPEVAEKIIKEEIEKITSELGNRS